MKGWVAVFVALAVLGACRPEIPELRVVGTIEIPTTAATSLHVARDGRIWLGEPGAFYLVEGPATYLIIPVPGESPPRVVSEEAGRILATTGTEALLLDASSGEIVGAGTLTGEPFLDVRTRWVFTATESGAVLIYDPRELTLVSAWAARGAPSSAIAGSPEGDRIYQALAVDGVSTILTRDLQTGRILRRSSFPAPFTALRTDPAGNLIGILGDEREAAVVSLRPWGEELELRWRERIPGTGPGVRIRLDAGGTRLAVLGDVDNGNGLRVLDAETGRPLGHLPDSPLDAAFDPSGRLLLLYPDELRVAR
jgi:hypothetical protein